MFCGWSVEYPPAKVVRRTGQNETLHRYQLQLTLGGMPAKKTAGKHAAGSGQFDMMLAVSAVYWAITNIGAIICCE